MPIFHFSSRACELCHSSGSSPEISGPGPNLGSSQQCVLGRGVGKQVILVLELLLGAQKPS